MAPRAFEDALMKLVNDERYRSDITANPRRLPEDFDLDDEELGVLLDVWRHTTRGPGDVEAHGFWCCSCCC